MSPFWISVATSATATAITFIAGIAAAWAMSRYRGRARGILDGILTLPLVLPPTVVGYFLLLLFGRRSGLGRALEAIGISIVFSWPATVIAASVVAFPLMYRATLGAFEQVTPNLIAAARTLGATPWRTFRQVLVPVAWPGVMAGTVLAFARALGEFGATLMLAGNIPGRTETMPVAIFFAAESGDLRGAMAWVGWTIAMSLAAITALNHWARPRPRRSTGRAAAPVPHPSPTAPAPAPPATLDVAIRRRTPDFALDVAFASPKIAMLGASGSGKSMTLRCIAGVEDPDEGRIVLNHRVLFDSAAGIRVPPHQRRVGMVFQDYALFPHMTVEQNIAFGLRARTPADWAALVGVAPLLHRYPDELSGGERQRVALARALAMEPEALLLDEPFSALDPHIRRQLEDLLAKAITLNRGATVFVSHDRDEAYRLCEELLVLSHGRIATTGPRQQVFANPRTVGAARVTGCRNIAPLTVLGPNEARVDEWGCTLRIPAGNATHIGIRAHHLRLLEAAEGAGDNTFPCEIAHRVESPFEATFYLRLPGAATLLEAEIPAEDITRLSQARFVRFEKLLLLRTDH